ncbi:terminase large subunit [Prochlorococcus phage MED4-213]|uniref:Terminase large subunit n=1 Tax=Prochlorococcus phage MED4-213 TaxID=889956 RepID=M4QPS3_9CAUD|nr:terminase large subunit [Prochlorococcus phage MED4-213]AGH26110.1 terminase large subunit [Prochlorococcus phage MED4-213]
MSQDFYLGNPNLKKVGTEIQFTKEQIQEYLRCKEDPVYFAMSYIKIISLDEGIVPFKMWDFQQELIESFHENRFNIAKLPRQTGKSTTCVSYLLHYILFNDNVNVGILANKLSTARDLLGRLQLAYEQLPLWLQQGIVVYNKGSMELENGSKILAASTSASAVRGMSFNIIFLDEFAFIPNHIAEQFFSSVYPTITSGTSTKVIIISTPNGMNHFYKLWVDAQKGRNGYAWNEVHWSKVPGRDAKWKETTIANTSERQFTQEFECEFLGSVDTLITASKLRTLTYDDVVTTNGSLDVYEQPMKDHDYIICVDVSRGLAQDYSAFVVIDITHAPWRLVAKYRDKDVRPMLFPNIIYNVANNYNKAYVLTEVNDIGEAVSASLFYDLEYENVLMCAMRGRAGQIVGQGFSGTKVQMGVKMSKTVKAQGCSNLKTLIEDDKLLVKDYNIVSELTTFIQVKQSFEADEGYNDDLVMCLVIFAWLVQQEYFKEMTDQDIRRRIYEEQKNAIEQDMAPFGFIDDGLEEEREVDSQGNIWRIDMNEENQEKWKLDEYGDMASLWEYR